MKKTNALLAVMLLSLMVISCKKPGCTDPEATNFQANAKHQDTICRYEGSVVFWYDEETSDSLKSFFGGDSLKFWVEHNYVDSLSVIDNLDEAPECGDKDVATYLADFGSSNFRWVQYEIFNEFGLLLYDSIIKLEANECHVIQLQQ